MKTPNTINGKTPDEIKKGLDACGVLDGDCENCPYDDRTIYCSDRMRKDALAYIQQLETGIDKVLKLVQSADKQIREKLIELESRLAQAERERDAMMAYMKEAGCEHCKYAPSPNDIYVRNECCDCVRKCNFEWRGVCEQNTKGESECR